MIRELLRDLRRPIVWGLAALASLWSFGLSSWFGEPAWVMAASVFMAFITWWAVVRPINRYVDFNPLA